VDLAESESLDAPEGTYRRVEEVKEEELVQEELLDVEEAVKDRGHEPREVCVMCVCVCVCVCACVCVCVFGRALFYICAPERAPA